MTQAPNPKRRIDGGSILLAAAIGLLFIWVLSSGACWSLGTGSWSLHNGILGTLGFMSLLQLALAIYVGFDAHRRGMHGFLWGALVLFTSIVGLVVYLIVCSGVLNQSQADFHQSQAPPQPAGAPGKVCGSCRSPVEPDFKMCPYCGEELDRSCAGCGKKQQSGWQVCPYCGKPPE